MVDQVEQMIDVELVFCPLCETCHLHPDADPKVDCRKQMKRSHHLGQIGLKEYRLVEAARAQWHN